MFIRLPPRLRPAVASSFLAILSTGVSAQGAEQQAGPSSPCDAPELAAAPGGPSAYVDALCQGYAFERAGDLESAVASYTRALEVPFHEGANFVLLPHVGNLHARLGDNVTATRLWTEAEVAFGVFFSIFVCSPARPGALPIGAERFDTVAAESAARRMCGDAREWIYQRSSMDLLLADRPRLHLYAVRRAERDLIRF